MIKIIFRQTEMYYRLEVKGHAYYDVPGKDIVCAAVSIIVINTINSLEVLTKENFECNFDEETGFIDCEFKGKLQDKSRFLVDSMIFNLKELSKEYGKKYLLVKFEEV